jgi:signal peptidase I
MKKRLVYLFIIAAIVIPSVWFLRIYEIDGTSMNYGLVEGDIVVCSTHIGTIRRGDMLVVRHPLDPYGRLYIKRVAALPGDSWFQKRRRFYLQLESNSALTLRYALRYDLHAQKTPYGYFLEEPYAKYYGIVHNRNLTVPSFLSDSDIQRIKPEHYLMLGDYRDNSADSRFFGAVPRDWIFSKVILVIKFPHAWEELLQIKEAD